MKIRIRGNAVRFRLTKTEVQQLCEQGFVTQETRFAANTFTYAVRMHTAAVALQATFKDNTITLWLPESLGKDWFVIDCIGFNADFNGLHLLLEKDFTCLDNRLEDQSDNYPNPKMADKS